VIDAIRRATKRGVVLGVDERSSSPPLKVERRISKREPSRIA